MAEKQNKKPSFPLYRHRELYEWSDEYQKRKFYTKKDFARERRLRAQWQKGISDKSGPAEYPAPVNPQSFSFENRYAALKQNTMFFKNMYVLNDLFERCQSYSELALKCIAKGIDEPKIRFFLLYTQMNYDRVLMFGETPRLSAEAANLTETEINERFTTMHLHDILHYRKYEKMIKDSLIGGDPCGYKAFIEREF